jgi:hypothetical protein
MTIQRSGPTPAYGDYLTRYVLIPKSQTLPSTSPIFGFHQVNWVEVPSYQRGIAWTRENVEEFVNSQSILLGNVILGSFPITPQLALNFPSGKQPGNYFILVDGLQRFAVGTALLSVLHPICLDQNPSDPNLQVHFQPICNQLVQFAPVYMHNDDFLLKYPRDVVRVGYERIRREIENYVNEETRNSPAIFGADCVRLLLDRQVAIDEYFNFSSTVELMNTFIGINTIRMDLSPVDLLRAQIVEQAEAAGWTAINIETMENDFADVFTVNAEKVRSELLPFVGIILQQISDQNGPSVFPTWQTGLTINDVDEFLSFITDFLNTPDTYVVESRQCGAIPFACMLTFYYREFLKTGSKPTILSGGNSEWPELHEFLRGVYRAVVAGKIGRTKAAAKEIYSGSFGSLADLGERISQDQTSFSLSQNLSMDWLMSSLELADKNRSKRIFNAMLLGLAPHSGGARGAQFAPLMFGRKANDFHIDHLFPASMKTQNAAGAREVESIKNFAPFPQNQNTIAKATSCSHKLSAGGIYDVYIQLPTPHPYCVWLIGNQQAHSAMLDDQQKLQMNASPRVGDERIEAIAKELELRL